VLRYKPDIIHEYFVGCHGKLDRGLGELRLLEFDTLPKIGHRLLPELLTNVIRLLLRFIDRGKISWRVGARQASTA
jgi:hypothetical protein